MSQTDTQNFLEEAAIFDVIRRERFARDQGRWDELASYFTEDSSVKTTWFEGTGADFAKASEAMASNGRHSKHPIWPIWARINNDRALAESYSQIQNRSTIDGVEVDMLQHCRFFSQLVRTEDGWRIKSFEAIYQKDSIAPVNPGAQVPIEWAEVEGFRASYRIWAWSMTKRGHTVPMNLLGDDRPDLVADFYARMDAWLAAG